MKTPPSVHPSRREKMVLLWTLTAFGVSLAALFCVGYLLRNFYLATAPLAPGKPIRPMGTTFALSITTIASIAFGDACALMAVVLARGQTRRRLIVLAVLAAILAWVPAVVSDLGFSYIVEVHNLILSK